MPASFSGFDAGRQMERHGQIGITRHILRTEISRGEVAAGIGVVAGIGIKHAGDAADQHMDGSARAGLDRLRSHHDRKA